MFVYFDETEVETAVGEKFLGCGMVISKEEISPLVIQAALSELDRDPHRHVENCRIQDDRTLVRGYFHACDDSKNSHSHLLTALSLGKDFKGVFSCYFVRSDNIPKDRIWPHFITELLAIQEKFGSDDGRLEVIFEESQYFAESKLRDWLDNAWHYIMPVFARFPFIQRRYPQLNIRCRGKSEPGLQMVDFLLWAAGRNYFSKAGDVWFGRVCENSWNVSSYEVPGGKVISVYFSSELIGVSSYGPEDYEKYLEMDEFKDPSVVVRFISSAYHVIGKVVLESNFMILDQKLLRVAREVLDMAGVKGLPAFLKFAECFLKLFDTVKVIEAGDPVEQKAFWLRCKQLLAICLLDNAEGVVTADRLSAIRDLIIDMDEGSLGQCASG